jgi:hypothetical protein
LLLQFFNLVLRLFDGQVLDQHGLRHQVQGVRPGPDT